jgi:hypothetical protein
MQQHLSQVEERMVLLEAENRTLKGKMWLLFHLYILYIVVWKSWLSSLGKLSNMHQNNGFAEKKYHGKFIPS